MSKSPEGFNPEEYRNYKELPSEKISEYKPTYKRVEDGFVGKEAIASKKTAETIAYIEKRLREATHSVEKLLDDEKQIDMNDFVDEINKINEDFKDSQFKDVESAKSSRVQYEANKAIASFEKYLLDKVGEKAGLSREILSKAGYKLNGKTAFPYQLSEEELSEFVKSKIPIVTIDVCSSRAKFSDDMLRSLFDRSEFISFSDTSLFGGIDRLSDISEEESNRLFEEESNENPSLDENIRKAMEKVNIGIGDLRKIDPAIEEKDFLVTNFLRQYISRKNE